jgi:carbamoyl-phosphate synthase small subunit
MTATAPWTTEKPTALLVLADGTVIEGKGIGATGKVQAEVCFNTALTGYEEILTDPSYLGQIVTFTFPHIGNVGTNDEDIEDLTPAARHGAVGVIFKADITDPSNYRAAKHLDQWLKARGIIGLCGIDTRALTAWIRENGMPNGVIAHDPNGVFDIEQLKADAKAWSGLEGLDLAKVASSGQSSQWSQTPWVWNEGYGATSCASSPASIARSPSCRRRLPRMTSSISSRMASFSRTAPVTRQRPANMPCPSSRIC